MLQPQRYQKFSPVSWDTRCLSENEALRSGALSMSAKALRRVYSMRVLRYWFVYHFLRIEYQRLAQPLSVCEVGIDVGQMLQFMRSAAAIPGISAAKWSAWTGVDCRVQRSALDGLGYTRLIEADIERSDSWLEEKP